MPDDSQYKLPFPWLEKFVNYLIGFIFYYRLIIVGLSFWGILYYSNKVWMVSPSEDKLKNGALVLTCGSIIIGIFYSIINYEHNKSKFNHEVKSAREVLTYNASCKMQESETIEHLRKIKTFYEANKTLFLENKLKEIDTLLLAQIDSRTSFMVIFNYFEGIAIATEQGIMDEAFIKNFFKTIFLQNLKKFGSYIEFMQKEYDSERIFWKYMALAEKWNIS